jgi:hypothetical protein
MSTTHLVKDLNNGASRAVEMTGDAFSTVVNVVLQALDGVVDGMNTVTNSTGDVTQKIMTGVSVRTTQIFKNVGDASKEVSDALGRVVDVIPLVGGPSAYLVKRAGDGVYHVIVSVGKITGNSAKRVGQVAKKTTDLLVFTLGSSRAEVDEVGKAVTDLVSKLTKRSRGGGRATSRRNNRRRQRGGGGLSQRRGRGSARPRRGLSRRHW